MENKKPHGEICIKLEKKHKKNKVKISVLDNGPGFSSAIFEKISEAYISKKPGGMGLGLSIVRKILEDHGSQLELKNLTTDGAVASFSLGLLPN